MQKQIKFIATEGTKGQHFKSIIVSGERCYLFSTLIEFSYYCEEFILGIKWLWTLLKKWVWIAWRERNGRSCEANNNENNNKNIDGDNSCHHLLISLCAGHCPEHFTLCHYLHFINKETEAEMGKMTWLMWHQVLRRAIVWILACLTRGLYLIKPTVCFCFPHLSHCIVLLPFPYHVSVFIWPS